MRRRFGEVPQSFPFFTFPYRYKFSQENESGMILFDNT